jgi:hypothetical protein
MVFTFPAKRQNRQGFLRFGWLKHATAKGFRKFIAAKPYQQRIAVFYYC